MADIAYTSIINAWVSTEGSNGIMTNYTYYSILVVYTNGTRDIAEGRYNSIKPLLRYVRTPMDVLPELENTIRQIKTDITAITDQKIAYVVDSLYPIPDITGMNEVAAKELLQKNGLVYVPTLSYPQDTPPIGTVSAYKRNDQNFKCVDVRIAHTLPQVAGLMQDEALRILNEAGFIVRTEKVTKTDCVDGAVLTVARGDEVSMKVTLGIGSRIMDLNGMTLEEAGEAVASSGQTLIVNEEHSNAPAGRVYRWYANGNEVTVYISKGQAVSECRNVDIKWSNVNGSSGDTYTATAKYDVSKGTLSILLKAFIPNRNKYTIKELVTEPIGGKPVEGRCFGDPVIEGGRDNWKTIELKQLEARPDHAAVKLKCYYGLMKKEESIDLDFVFHW